MRYLALTAFCLLIPLSAQAKSITGADIYDRCKADASTSNDSLTAYHSGFCYGFIQALIETYDLPCGKNADETHAITFCLPPRVTTTQIVKVLMKYLDDHPEELHESAVVLLIASLHEVFPCGHASTAH